MNEIEITLEDKRYSISKLPLAQAQEVLVKLFGLLGGAEGLSENPLATLPSKLRVEDINFLRERLFGAHCHYINEQEKHVPMGKALVESHFAGRPGLMLHLLVQCVKHNFSDFLADLRLDDLVGATAVE